VILRTQITSPLRNFFWVFIAIVASLILVILPIELVLIGIFGIVFIAVSNYQPLLALILLLVFAPLRTLIATESNWALPLDIGQLLIVWYALSYGIKQILHRQSLLGFLRAHWVISGLLVFLIATGISGFVAWDMGTWLTEWLKWWVVLAVVLLTVAVGRGQRWHWLVFALVVAGVANAIVGIYIFFGGSGADHLVINGRFFRAFGTFGQPNPFGGFMGMIAPLAIMMTLAWLRRAWLQWRTQSTSSWRISVLVAGFYGISSAVIGVALIMSWSRGAWLSLVVAGGATLFTLPKTWGKRLLLVLVTGSVVAGVWFSDLLPDAIVNRVASSTEELFMVNDVRGVDITGENYAVVERLAHWQAALIMAEHHPWWGVGFGNYAVAYDAYRLINWDEALGHAHNYYLNILAEAGMIGTLAYSLMWLFILGTTWHAQQHPHKMARLLVAGLMGSWAYILTHSLLDNLYVNNIFVHLGVMLGIVIILHEQGTRFNQWGNYVTSQSGRS
jgi:putative inorganic carbon (HCO3(-)) transporter